VHSTTQAGDLEVSFPKRKKYSVKDVLNGLKKINATPSITYDVGNQLIYYQWSCCKDSLGEDHPVTTNLSDLLEFMQSGYEQMLVRGDFWRTGDTPNAAFNSFLKDRPDEFISYVFEREPEYILGLLELAAHMRDDEIKKHKTIEGRLRKLIKDNPEDPDLWNELRLVLWIIGDYKEASEAFKNARSFGWTGSVSTVVGI
jgi:tetratricopeptide (TPR) repeat protein